VLLLVTQSSTMGATAPEGPFWDERERMIVSAQPECRIHHPVRVAIAGCRTIIERR